VPADFRFYIQDLKLIDADGKEAPVKLDSRAPWQSKDLALIDFEDAQGHCHGTAETNTSITAAWLRASIQASASATACLKRSTISSNPPNKLRST
jgi:hypothetical protein